MRVTRILLPFVAALAVAAVAVPAASAADRHPNRAATVVPKIGFYSSAWGTYVTAVDKAIQSGPTSSASIACTSASLVRSNTLVSVNLPVVGHTGTITSKVTTTGGTTTGSTTSTAKVQGINLLGGAVVADAVTTTATATSNAEGQSGTGSTSFTGLKVLGQTIAVNVAPNTKISLVVGGTQVGTVNLNYQTKATTNGVFTQATRGIVITLLASNPYGLPASTAIYIGAANAGVASPRIATAGGSGWGLSANLLNGTAVIGRQPHVGVPCYGGTGTGSLATVTRAPLVSTGTTLVTTTSSGSATTASSKVVTSIAKPSILGGLITADALIAESQAVRTSIGTVATTDNSKFVNLKVLGLPLINSNVAPNTTVNVLGLGAVTFHKSTRTRQGLEVVMLEIKLSASIAGLPTGTVVQVAGANAVVIV